MAFDVKLPLYKPVFSLLGYSLAANALLTASAGQRSAQCVDEDAAVSNRLDSRPSRYPCHAIMAG